MEERKHIVILAAGDFPTHDVPQKALRDADFIVCCDSAYAHLRDNETTRPEDPDVSTSRRLDVLSSFVVIGDGDSLSDVDKAALGDRWIHVAEQDYNDLHKAMQWATQRFSILNSQFSILGATGKREDHTLGNISYLVTFAEEYPGADIEMLTDYGRFVAMSGERSFASFPRQQVSIFTMTPAVSFSATGLRWPLDGFHARRWWQATLNEALGTEFTITSSVPIILFQTYESKY